jgi:autotransporter-associated beta strand protein
MPRPYRPLQNILFSLVLSCLVAVPARSAAATAEDFRTQEYWNSTGLELINAATAYAQGYTGQGIVLGILDSPIRLSHPELAGQVLGDLLPTGYPAADWERDKHGTHVAGIMVALRNGLGMQGVAFNAQLSAVALDLRDGVTHLPAPDFLSLYAAMPDLKIINNSWGSDVFPYEGKDSVAEVLVELLKERDTSFLCQLVTAYGKVAVFSAGNEGHISPEAEPLAPRYYAALRGWLSVVSVDPAAITIDAAGNKTGDVQSVSVFSNLAQGAELFTVAAPGSNINSLDATGSGTGYRLDSGTSMAAPYVSGSLALVQQAFPWMTGKQLADTVLTTADNAANGRFTPPDFTVTVEENSESDTEIGLRVLLHYIDKAVPTSVLADLQTYYRKNAEALQQYYAIASFSDFLKAYQGDFTYTTDSGVTYSFGDGLARRVTFASVFGQGLLNVGLAVRGPASLDANRLASSDSSATYRCALYGVDTQGYTAVFGNDISQRQWDNALHHRDYQYVSGDDPTDPLRADAVALIGQNVGLLKDGAGTLVLTGSNTYAGATVVRGGTLSLTSVTGDATSGRLVNSSVTVESGGLLTGDGTVDNAVTNEGTFVPGNGDLGSAFTVGTYTQQAVTSRLILGLDASGDHTSLKATELHFNGGRIVLTSSRDYYRNQSLTLRFTDLISGTVSASGFDWNTDVVAGWYNTGASAPLDWVSPTLTAGVAVAQDASGTPTNLAVTYSRATNAYSRYAATDNDREVGAVFDQAAGAVGGDAADLVEALDFSSGDGSGVRSALAQLGPRQFAATARASLSSQRDLSQVLLGRLLGTVSPASPRPSSVAGGDTQGNPWHAFVSPLGGGDATASGHGFAAAKSTFAGVLAGLETERFTEAGAWSLGGHAAFLHRDQSSDGAGENNARSDGFHLGGQFRFVPRAWSSETAEGYTFGLARLGLESTTQHRGVDFNGFTRTAKSDWVSPVGSLLTGGGWNVTPRSLGGWVSLGPVAWLDYSAAWRPAVSEYGGQAINLRLRDGWSQSLRSSLGGRLSLDLSAKARPGSTVTADFLATWNHEYLGDHGNIRARFSDFGGSFAFRDTITDRDTCTLAAGVTAKMHDSVSIGLAAGTDLGGLRSAGWGSLNLGWTF